MKTKTIALSVAVAWTVMFASLIAAAAPPEPAPPAEPAEEARPERKLEGDELAKFHLQQILDQAEDYPLESDEQSRMQDLTTLARHLAQEHRQRLALQQAEAEQRSSETQGPAEQEAPQAADSDQPAVETAERPVVNLKPVVLVEQTGQRSGLIVVLDQLIARLQAVRMSLILADDAAHNSH